MRRNNNIILNRSLHNVNFRTIDKFTKKFIDPEVVEQSEPVILLTEPSEPSETIITKKTRVKKISVPVIPILPIIPIIPPKMVITKEGLGIEKPEDKILAGDELKIKILKSLMKKNKTKSMKGSGHNILKVIKPLLPSLGIDKKHFSFKKLEPIIKELGENYNGGIINKISKILLPALTMSKLKTDGKDINNHEEYMKNHIENGVHKHLGKALVNILVKKQEGGSFWDDFKQGFKSVLNVGLPILSIVAPEVTIPLTLMNKFL